MKRKRQVVPKRAKSRRRRLPNYPLDSLNVEAARAAMEKLVRPPVFGRVPGERAAAYRKRLALRRRRTKLEQKWRRNWALLERIVTHVRKRLSQRIRAGDGAQWVLLRAPEVLSLLRWAEDEFQKLKMRRRRKAK